MNNPKIPPPYRGPSVPSTKPEAPPPTASAPAPRGISGTDASQDAPSSSQSSSLAISGEGVMQRLRYFENLAEQYEHYIQVLQATIKRQGAAVPTAYFAPLNGDAGSYRPKASS